MNAIASWLKTSISAYLQAIHADSTVRQNLPVTTRNWNPAGSVRASSLGGCPKRAALKRLGYPVERPSTFLQAWRMEQGIAFERLVQEALVWATPGAPLDNLALAFNSQRQSGELAGQIDVVLSFHKQATALNLPVECKLVGAWAYQGLSLAFVLQTITYMKLLDEATTGFIVTLRDDKAAPSALTVWTLRKQELGYVILGDEDEPLLMEGAEWPASDVWYTVIPEDFYAQRVTEHLEWLTGLEAKTISATDTAPYLSPFTQWTCGKVTAPVYYKRSGSYVDRKSGSLVRYKANDMKPNTGILTNICPAFALCWGGMLREVGYAGERPEILELSEEHGLISLRKGQQHGPY